MAQVNVRNRNKNKAGREPNWEYRFEVGRIGGHRKQFSKSGFKTKREALEAGAKALSEYCDGNLINPTEISMSDFLDEWFEKDCKAHIKITSQETYASAIKLYLKPLLGAYKVKWITPIILQDFANKIGTMELSKSRITCILAVLTDALDYAVFPAGIIKNNPVRYIKKPIGKTAHKRKPLSFADFSKIEALFPFGTKYHILLELGWNCGLRISEALGVTWDDIDLKNGIIHIEHQYISKSSLLLSPKYGSTRDIKISERLLQILIEEFHRQETNKEKYGNLYTLYYGRYKTIAGEEAIIVTDKVTGDNRELKFVCVDENGEKVSPGGITHMSKKIKKTLGFDFEYHSLRHSHATILIDNGANPKAVQHRLGHKDIRTTLNIYVHATDKMARESVDIFEKAANRATLT